MLKYTAADHRMIGLTRWNPELHAVRIAENILLSPGVSNAYVVTGDDGDVIINTGMPNEGARHRERFESELGRKLDVSHIVLTQSHPDHIGGWEEFADAGASIHVQRDFPWIWTERHRLGMFFNGRSRRVLPMLVDRPAGTSWTSAVKEIPVERLSLFATATSFSVGNRRFELHATPSGETLDSLVVWLPEERVLFTGNLMGALQGSLPNFYTARGDRDRSVGQFLRDIDHLIGLEPALMITGHGEPVVGASTIASQLTRLRDAVRYIYDATIDGMDAGKSLHQLMAEIELPENLKHQPGRAPVSWYVRAVWEELCGWFRQESTTELYPVPQKAVWNDLIEAAGADTLLARAQAHLTAGRPVEALHLTEMLVGCDPANRDALKTQVDAIELLIERGEGAYFDEQGWLETERKRALSAMGEA
jgi:glyoxylase-like metal-dependent hydrolase (beta-lactamase superfamily II)